MDNAAASGPAYCVASGLKIRFWGGEAGVVYDPGRARTHLVSAEAVAVLSAASPIDAESLPGDLMRALAGAGLLLRN